MKKSQTILNILSAKFYFIFMSLLTALIVKNSHILDGIHYMFLKNCPRPNLKAFPYQIWTSV